MQSRMSLNASILCSCDHPNARGEGYHFFLEPVCPFLGLFGVLEAVTTVLPILNFLGGLVCLVEVPDSTVRSSAALDGGMKSCGRDRLEGVANAAPFSAVLSTSMFLSLILFVELCVVQAALQSIDRNEARSNDSSFEIDETLTREV